MNKHYLEYKDASSAKFWEAILDGNEIHVRFGKIGTAGQNQIKKLSTPEEAHVQIQKLVNDKIKKGYEPA